MILDLGQLLQFWRILLDIVLQLLLEIITRLGAPSPDWTNHVVQILCHPCFVRLGPICFDRCAVLTPQGIVGDEIVDTRESLIYTIVCHVVHLLEFCILDDIEQHDVVLNSPDLGIYIPVQSHVFERVGRWIDAFVKHETFGAIESLIQCSETRLDILLDRAFW